MDATYIRMRGQWKHLYGAVDSYGLTSDFLLTAKRDTAAILRFFRKAIRQHGEPEVVTIDKSGANITALTELNIGREKDDCIKVRQSNYLNSLVEQDHRNIKRRIKLITGSNSSGGHRLFRPVTKSFTCYARGSFCIRTGTVCPL